MNAFNRKLISLLLIMVLSFGGFNCSFTYAKTNGIDDELSEALEVLRLFEIIPDYYDYNTPFDREVSRAEFVDAVVNLINRKHDKSEDVYYYDVPKTHFAYNGICTLTHMGIISGIGGGLFKPDEPIEDAAAYKILSGILGYDVYAEIEGGYPTGYVNAARRAEIYVGTSSAYLTHEEMFRILYNTLLAELDSTISSSDEETLLSRYYDSYKMTGIVTGADCISLNDISLSKADEVLIDNVLYRSQINLNDYLGQKIDFIYREDSDDEAVVLWARQKDDMDVLQVNVDHDASFNEDTFEYTYTDGNKSRKISINRGVLLIYNGRVIDNNYGDIFNLPKYTVKFFETNNTYDVAVVKAYENYVVDLLDITNLIVYDKMDSSKFLKLDEDLYDYLSVRRADGNEMQVSDIKKDDVLSVFMSKDEKRLEVIVENSNKVGVVASKNKNDRNCEITIEDNIYYMPIEYCRDNFNSGDNVKLYLDYSGCVAAVSVEGGSTFAAYVYKIVKDSDSEDLIKLRMFKQDGTIGLFECAQKISLDGKKTTAAIEIETALSEEGEFKPQLVLVRTNSDGAIIEIDTKMRDSKYETAENTLMLNLDYEQRHYKIQGYFNFEAAIDDNTVIFGVPSDDWSENAKESDYRIIKKSELMDDSRHYVMSYNATDRNGYEQYLVIKEPKTSEYGRDLPILVTGKGTAVNADDEVVEYIQGYQGNIQKSILSDGELSFNDIKEGMVVRLSFDKDGNAVNKSVLYDPENAEKYYTTTAPFNNIYGVEVGFVNDIVGDVIKIGYGSGANVNHVSNLYNSPPILVYDTDDDRNPAYVGSFADVKRYYNVYDECSQVVLVTRHCTPLVYIFYN